MPTIVIDPGHGGSDPGAVNGNRFESHDNLRMALAVGAILSRCPGYRVIYTRTDDRFVSLTDRNRISNNANADAFVSIHRNASVNPAANGVENYVRVGANARARRLANNTLNNIVRIGVQRNRGLFERDFQVLRLTNAPAQLLELGFISNAEDNRLFDQNFNAYAQAIANGIIQEFGGCNQTTPPISPPTNQTTTPPTTGPNCPSRPDETVRAIQRRLNREFGQSLAEDGILGPLTRRALVRAYQMQLNTLNGCRTNTPTPPVTAPCLVTDGIFGPMTRAATRLVRQGDRGNLVWILQSALYFNCFRTNPDGIFGPLTAQTVRNFQTFRGLSVDGIAGPNTFQALLQA